MRNILFLCLCMCFLQSCYTTSRSIDDKFVKQEIRMYKRVGDDYRLHKNVLRMYIVLKMTNSAYEIYTEASEGIMGKFTLRNDTLTLCHEYQIEFLDSAMNISQIDGENTVSDFYPTKFVVRKDSLIDITNYCDYPEYQNVFVRPKENYIIVK